MGGEFRPGRLRHRRHHGRAGARPARLRVRAQVRAPGTYRRSWRRRHPHGRRADGGGARRGPPGRLWRVHRRRHAGRHRADDRRRAGAWHRHGRGAVPAEGLGHLAPALLGYTDPDYLLREGRRRRSTVRATAGGTAAHRAVHRARRLATGAGRGLRELHLPDVRRAGTSRNRHDGYVRRFLVVLPAVLRSEERRPAVFAGGREILDAGRLLQRRRRARDPPPAVLALLHARPQGRRPAHLRRAVQAPADAGHGAEGRRGDVEVEGQRRRPRYDAGEVRRRRAAPLRHVRCAAREGSGVERLRARGQLPVPAPRLAPGRPLGRDGGR